MEDPFFKSTEQEPFLGNMFLISERYVLSVTFSVLKTPVAVKFTLQYLTDGYSSNTGGGMSRDVDVAPVKVEWSRRECTCSKEVKLNLQFSFTFQKTLVVLVQDPVLCGQSSHVHVHTKMVADGSGQ